MKRKGKNKAVTPRAKQALVEAEDTEKPGIINKILRLEQEGEHLHAVINRIERNLTMTLNKSTQYWQVLRDYENKLYNGLK